MKEPDAPLRSENSSAKQQVQLRSHFFCVEAPRRTPASSGKFAAFLVTRRSVGQSHQFRHDLLSSPFPISAAHQASVLPCGRGARPCGAVLTVLPQKRRTCLINFCLCIPRQCGVSVAVDATWKTQIRLAVLGFLQLVCDLALSTRKLAATEVLSHACRTLGDACTP